MTKRQKNIIYSSVTLTIGWACYVVFRSDTRVAHLFDDFYGVESLRKLCTPLANGFICFYLPDMLWAFALSTGLIAVYSPQAKGTFFCGGTTFLCGCAWEALQHLGLVSGTSDVFDIVMYLSASLFSIIINLKGENL